MGGDLRGGRTDLRYMRDAGVVARGCWNLFRYLCVQIVLRAMLGRWERTESDVLLRS